MILFGLAPPQGVFALQGGDWLHIVRAADGVALARRVRSGALAFVNQIFHRAGTSSIERRDHAVLVEEVNVVFS